MTDATARLTAALADRYVIERELGAGGMATVYLARDLKHEREVALKVLRPELAAVLGAERFLNEIKISARLDHPHILTLIDSGAADSFLYYVLPYVRGESLRASTCRSPVACSGLMYCGVPSERPVSVSRFPPASFTASAMPKSASIASPSWIRMFSGLMSRCTTPWRCA